MTRCEAQSLTSNQIKKGLDGVASTVDKTIMFHQSTVFEHYNERSVENECQQQCGNQSGEQSDTMDNIILSYDVSGQSIVNQPMICASRLSVPPSLIRGGDNNPEGSPKLRISTGKIDVAFVPEPAVSSDPVASFVPSPVIRSVQEPVIRSVPQPVVVEPKPVIIVPVPQPVKGISSSGGVNQVEVGDDISCSGTEEVPLLTDNNFEEWRQKIIPALKTENLWTVVEGTLSLDSAASPKFIKLLYQRKIKAVRIIIQSIPAGLSNALFGSLNDDDMEDPVLVWNVVNDYFDSKAKTATNVHSFEPSQSISLNSASSVSSLHSTVESVDFFSDGCPVGCKGPCEHFVSHYPSDSDEEERSSLVEENRHLEVKIEQQKIVKKKHQKKKHQSKKKQRK